MLFSAPEVHLRMLRDIYVDQIVYATHINKVISRLNNEWQEFILYVSVLDGMRTRCFFNAAPVCIGHRVAQCECRTPGYPER